MSVYGRSQASVCQKKSVNILLQVAKGMFVVSDSRTQGRASITSPVFPGVLGAGQVQYTGKLHGYLKKKTGSEFLGISQNKSQQVTGCTQQMQPQTDLRNV